MKESLNKPRISREKPCSRVAPVVGIMLSLVPGWAGAAQQLLFEAQKLDGQGWSLEAPRLSVEPGLADALRLGVHVPRLRLSQPPVAVEDLELSCPVFNLFEDGGSSCADGKLAFRLEPWKPVSGKMAWRHGEEGFELVVDLLAPGQGEIKGRLGGQERIQRLKLELIGLALEPFFKLLLPEWSGSGRLDASSALEKGKGTGWRVDGSLRASRFNFSDAEGLHVGEELAFSLSAEGQGLPGSPDGNFKVALHSGQLYIDPFYLEFSPEAPFSLEARIEGSLTEERWRLEQLAGSYGGVMGFQGSGHFFSGGLEQLRMTFDVPQLGRFYPLFLQPLLIGTAADALQVKGALQGRLIVEEGRLDHLQLVVEQVDLEESNHLFEIEGLEGRVLWRRQGAVDRSSISWQGAHLYRFFLGPSEARFTAAGDRLVVEPLSVRMLDGLLKIHDLRLAGLTTGRRGWQAGAELQGIRLEALSQALEWPPLRGELNASIPKVRYENERLKLEGALVVEVFDGRVVIEGLQVEDLFGPAPVLETSIRLENLDLSKISQTFSFGRIEGSLEGHVRDLRLVGWEVAGFEALLRSPARDKRRHRISQRAINNLTELGNGVATGLSGTFLGMFKDFAYDRLELKIRLQGDTAELDGAPGPKGGYYIVKGARLPRVDVIGRNRRVAWKDLLSRIRGIRFEGVIVE